MQLFEKGLVNLIFFESLFVDIEGSSFVVLKTYGLTLLGSLEPKQ